jgi:hypothetical protein
MWARRRKPETDKVDLKPSFMEPGWQGVHREVGSEGHEEKYRGDCIKPGGDTPTM